MKKNLALLPVILSDAEAERFVDEADLSAYDLSSMIPLKFEFEGKNARINIRIPARLFEAVKDLAKEENMPYSRYIRLLIETKVAERLAAKTERRKVAKRTDRKTKTT